MRRWFAAAGVLVVAAAAAPAGATLVYVKNFATAKPSVWVATNGGHNRVRIGPGSTPNLAPDGSSVVYDAATGDLAKLMVSATSAPMPRVLLTDWRGYDSLAWSPDAKTIATVTGPELGTKNLVLVDVATGLKRQVASGYFNGVSFSPNGDQLVYASGPKENQRDDIYRVDVSGGTPTALTTGHNALSPLWGPKNIVFTALIDASKRKYGPKAELYTMLPDGSSKKRLTHQAVDQLLFGLTPTAFSEDGSRLLAQFGGQDTSYADAVNPSTGKVRPLHGATENGLFGAALSHDGRIVLGETGGFDPQSHHDVVTEPYAGGKLTVVVKNASQPDFDR